MQQGVSRGNISSYAVVYLASTLYKCVFRN